MKLSFSTRGWSGRAFDDFIVAAKATGFAGIELHGLAGSDWTREGAPFSRASASRTARRLFDEGLRLVCLDSVCDISTPGADDAELLSCIGLAHDFAIPYVRVRALDPSKEGLDEAAARIGRCLDVAREEGVVLLVETAGAFSDTARLNAFLTRFASDSLAALWDLHHPYFDHAESPETSVKNLGAYVKHVHVKDSSAPGEGRAYRLPGEGELPMEELMTALASINYDGFVSLEWDPLWMPELDDMESVLAHFANYMQRFGTPARSKPRLYKNRAGTGTFVWHKDILIDATFSRVLDRMAEEYPDQYAFKYTTLDYIRTYSQFREDVDECCRALISLGVGPGSHVAVWATNVPEWFVAFWAVTKIGAVLVTVNTAYKIHEAEYLLRQSDAHTLIMEKGYRDSDYAAVINEICPELRDVKPGEHLRSARLPFLRNVVTIGFRQPGCLTFAEAMRRASRTPVEEVRRLAAAVDPHDVCNMQYTSGTTGFPKGVMLTHYNIVNNGKCIGDRMDLSTADRMMIHVPMFHCFGMVLAMTAAMTHGATMLPLPYFSPKPALACVDREHITCFHGVPTMFIAMLEHEDFKKTDFSSVRTGIMAGSPCPISVMRDVVGKMHMDEVTIVFGQTEASPGCTMSSTDDPLDVRVGTVGRALPEVECRIVDPETGAELPAGQIGEFVARGYNIMKGYYKMPGATRAAIDRDGWLHTGDLACKTEDGNYRITGRLKDMIIRGGENIYPKEIEEFLYTHPKVRDVQVIGVPDAQYGEEIMACVILKEGETATEKELQDYVRASMARHKVPRYVEMVDSFPMNAAGKILKYKMREEAVEKLKLHKAASIETA
ncbi:MAG: Long-chain-fatty-acid--CoA ligase [Firmicutes bacterium ADurb.Bin248]|nr:MAG: Long-chain-fatty-acid--CoA ligase [Firmicutes bacterium ADurb.Bin248]HOG00896.1 AMP-binding protein [Clostridia bacterium]HPK16034.1 AMP-binding protein [Clostridia bacterium]